jgi:hypothetical protein
MTAAAPAVAATAAKILELPAVQVIPHALAKLEKPADEIYTVSSCAACILSHPYPHLHVAIQSGSRAGGIDVHGSRYHQADCAVCCKEWEGFPYRLEQ